MPIADVGVGLQLDAGDHPACIGDLVAPRRVTVSDNGRANLGKLAQFQWFQVIKKPRVLRLENRQVTIVPDEFNLRQIRSRVLETPEDDLARPTHHVRVGKDAFAFNYEPRATHPANRIEAPGGFPGGRLAEIDDLHD